MISDALIRPAIKEDEPYIAAVIRAVMAEFGADGPGFAIHDPEVDHMFLAYARERAVYFVATLDGKVAGGAGVAPLEGGPSDVCELRKMYFLPQARGRGLGEQMMRVCLAKARDLGYRACYLETLTGMDSAQKLYARVGFRPICGPMGATGHHGCDKWFILELKGTP